MSSIKFAPTRRLESPSPIKSRLRKAEGIPFDLSNRIPSIWTFVRVMWRLDGINLNWSPAESTRDFTQRKSLVAGSFEKTLHLESKVETKSLKFQHEMMNLLHQSLSGIKIYGIPSFHAYNPAAKNLQSTAVRSIPGLIAPFSTLTRDPGLLISVWSLKLLTASSEKKTFTVHTTTPKSTLRHQPNPFQPCSSKFLLPFCSSL